MQNRYPAQEAAQNYLETEVRRSVLQLGKSVGFPEVAEIAAAAAVKPDTKP